VRCISRIRCLYATAEFVPPPDKAEFVPPDTSRTATVSFFWWHRSIEGKMDLLHITPRALPRVSYLSLKISPTVRFRSRSFVLRPPQFCICSTTLYFPSPRVLSALLSFLPSPFHYSPLEHMGRKRTAEDYNRTTAENSWMLRAYEEEDRI
jgi:hypothetical protein